jgi:hypothetical protein
MLTIAEYRTVLFIAIGSIALKTSLHRTMNFAVIFKMVLAMEGTLAYGASVLPQIRVYQYVAYQFEFGRERLRTVTADERFFAGMREHVLVEFAGGVEALGTNATRVT